MSHTKFSRGFTLIELLVVISIIGLLSSVVLASLNTARAKGADGAIKGNLQGIRTQAALYYDDHSLSYGTPMTTNIGCTSVPGTVFDDPFIKQAIIQATSLGGASGGVRCSIGQGGQTWALAARLRTGPLWCVSSAGTTVFNGDAAGGGLTDAFCDDNS